MSGRRCGHALRLRAVLCSASRPAQLSENSLLLSLAGCAQRPLAPPCFAGRGFAASALPAPPRALLLLLPDGHRPCHPPSVRALHTSFRGNDVQPQPQPARGEHAAPSAAALQERGESEVPREVCCGYGAPCGLPFLTFS